MTTEVMEGRRTYVAANRDHGPSELFLSDETEFKLSMSMIRAGVAALKECKNEEETLLVSEIFFRMKEEEIKNKTPLNDVCIEREKLRADLAAVTAERDRMREALKPFADAVDVFIAENHDAHRAIVTLGDFFHARTAIDGVTEPVALMPALPPA